MQQIINFLIRNKNSLLFLLLFTMAILFTIQSHSYHKSKFINSANFFTGSIYSFKNNITQYFDLKSQNTILSQENNQLKTLLYNYPHFKDSTFIDSTSYNTQYKFTTSRIIKNSFSVPDNFLLLNKGTKDSIKQDLGVITNRGLLGIIDQTSQNYATVISILNTTIRISAQLKKTNHYGSLSWNTKDYNIVQLTDVPKIAPVKIGDTIITSGRSLIFPKGIPVGTINNFKLDMAENYYEIDVKLFNDMTNLEYAYIIENTNAKEAYNLLNKNR